MYSKLGSVDGYSKSSIITKCEGIVMSADMTVIHKQHHNDDVLVRPGTL